MKAHHRIHHFAKGLLVYLALLAAPAQAAPPTWLPPAEELPEGTILLQVEELKATYLHCDRLSSLSFLDSSTAAHCSLAAERLRRMGFDGRADAVLAWWKMMSQERRAPAPTPPETPVASSTHSASL
jgi:hypothetical protein